MKGIADVAAVICAAAIASSLISILIPQGSTKKVLSAVIGVFILCTLIVPIKNAVSGISLELDVLKLTESITASADEAYEDAVIKETKSRLESSVASYLLSEGFKVKTAEIKLGKDDISGINIKSLRIYIDKSEIMNSVRIIDLIKRKYEVYPVIKVS